MELLFVVTLALAATALAQRWLSRRALDRRAQDGPGRNPQQAVRVESFRELDAIVHATRCPCGGPVTTVAEGSRTIDGETVRVVQAECTRCERELSLFFITPSLH